MKDDKIIIVGAGLVGTMLSIFLAKRGFQVEIFEKRTDLRTLNNQSEGRSINLALSTRGWNALEKIQLSEKVKEICIAMNGRMIHDINGNTNFQSYTIDNKAIYSVSRSGLTSILLNEAEKHGVKINFQHECININFDENTIEFQHKEQIRKIVGGKVFGADGASSVLRNAMIKRGPVNYSQDYLDYGYKEIIMPCDDGGWKINSNSLHIWPRKNFMLIALPNLDGSFTCTLFLHLHGTDSFQGLNDKNQVKIFFNTYFKDALEFIPNLEDQFFEHPTGTLATIKTFPWRLGENYCLIGDAAHAIVPFYGQGMNCGFEDCAMLDEIIDEHKENWDVVFSEFENQRKPDTDAIAQMALQNFIEMRDLVADENFLKKKKLETQLKKEDPSAWTTQYEMVTFSNIPYNEALKKGLENDRILAKMLHEKEV